MFLITWAGEAVGASGLVKHTPVTVRSSAWKKAKLKYLLKGKVKVRCLVLPLGESESEIVLKRKSESIGEETTFLCLEESESESTGEATFAFIKNLIFFHWPTWNRGSRSGPLPSPPRSMPLVWLCITSWSSSF